MSTYLYLIMHFILKLQKSLYPDFNGTSFSNKPYSLLNNKSPLPLTEPRDAAPHAHRVVHRCGQSV